MLTEEPVEIYGRLWKAASPGNPWDGAFARAQEMGLEPRVRHLRKWDSWLPGRLPGEESTHVTIRLEGDVHITGVAHCNPKDQYCKKTGRDLAAWRILQWAESNCANRLSGS